MFIQLSLLFLACLFAEGKKVNISREACSQLVNLQYDPIDAKYDEYFNKCIVPVKGRCSTVSGIHCTQYAECRWDSKDYKLRCACRDHFSISEDGLSCVLGEGEGGPCNPTKDLDGSGCDTKYGLECIPDKETLGKEVKGKCGCGKDKLWNNNTNKCMPKDCSQRMKFAFPDERNTGNCYLELWKEHRMQKMLDLRVFCPPGAVSKLDVTSLHFCTCDEKTHIAKPEKNGCLLLKSNEESCQDPVVDEICNSAKLLLCINGTCQCDQEQPGGWNSNTSTCNNDAFCERSDTNLFFDLQTQECLGTIGEAVFVAEFDRPNRILHCPANSTSYFEPHDQKMCVCNRKFKSSPDARGCVPSE